MRALTILVFIVAFAGVSALALFAPPVEYVQPGVWALFTRGMRKIQRNVVRKTLRKGSRNYPESTEIKRDVDYFKRRPIGAMTADCGSRSGFKQREQLALVIKADAHQGND